ncbi:uncharacterized protein LOC117022083 [Rhinolophus ferrumequinum]|uniref:uncharacterized protein LOC117022083 n=1 Tax=Rhinolophus ferrumequinum TaxID=59479 RepID=UPI00140FE44A|nr:uncharacterized protein LOC117022083 [Rhinolophus ferrumequinum]
MAQCVSLLVFLHGVLTLQMKGVLGLSDESSDSSPGYRKSYYIFQMLQIQRLKGKPENAFDRKAADLLAMRTSSVFGVPDIIRPTVNTAACFQLPPVPVIPRQSAPARTPPILGNTALSGPVLTLATQPKVSDRNGVTSVPGSLGTYFSVSARFSPIPQVLTTPGLPTKGALHSTSFPTSFTTKEPRGDITTDRDSLQDFSGVMCAANEMKELEPTQTEEALGVSDEPDNCPDLMALPGRETQTNKDLWTVRGAMKWMKQCDRLEAAGGVGGRLISPSLAHSHPILSLLHSALPMNLLHLLVSHSSQLPGLGT